MYWIIITLIVIAEIAFGCLFPEWNFVFWLIGITMFAPFLWSISLWLSDTIHNYFDK